jgi:hypothetical protein
VYLTQDYGGAGDLRPGLVNEELVKAHDAAFRSRPSGAFQC